LSSIFNSKAQGRQSRHLKETIDRLRGYSQTHSVYETIVHILDLTSPWAGGQSLRKFWSSEKNREKILQEGSSNLENVLTLAEMGRDFTDCKKFVSYINSLLTNFRSAQEEAHKVNLLTVHKAKGKEYTLVFVVGLNEQLMPHKNAFLEKDQVGVADGAKDLIGLEEERRICYVAITRAKRFLILSTFSHWRMDGEGRGFIPSRFFEEMDLKQAEMGYDPRPPGVTAIIRKARPVNGSAEDFLKIQRD